MYDNSILFILAVYLQMREPCIEGIIGMPILYNNEPLPRLLYNYSRYSRLLHCITLWCFWFRVKIANIYTLLIIIVIIFDYCPENASSAILGRILVTNNTIYLYNIVIIIYNILIFQSGLDVILLSRYTL